DVVPLITRYASETEAALGPDHPDAVVFRAGARSAVTLAEMAAGDLPAADAVAAAEEDQRKAMQASGPDSDAALIARCALAEANRRTGRLMEAIAAGELNLAECVRLRGESSHLTLLARNNLGAAYRDAGRLPEAVALFERNRMDAPAILPAGHHLLERILQKVP